MNLLEMYKQLNDEEKEEFIKSLIKDMNSIQKEAGQVLLIN